MYTRAAVCCFAVLFASATARADVRDDAGIFTAGAVADANATLADAERTYGKQLIVETWPTVPADRRAALAADKEGFFRGWLAERAKARDANGVFVLVCMDPKYVRVSAGVQTRRRGIFTPDDLDALKRQLAADLRAGRYDAALAGAVRTVTQAYAARVPAGPPPATAPADLPAEPPTTRPADGGGPASVGP